MGSLPGADIERKQIHIGSIFLQQFFLYSIQFLHITAIEYCLLYTSAWQDADVIESWTEISHQEKKSVVLNQFASGYLPIRRCV